MPTKVELEDQLEQLADLIDEGLDAKLSREEVIAKLKEMKDVIEADEEEDEDSDSEEAEDEGEADGDRD
jgi:hypothetical protein